jgi:hypothetical protein
MMTGQGPYGPVEMGGMFTTVKVRQGLARNDYQDPGWYRQPAGSFAREWSGAPAPVARAPSVGADAATGRARKPSGHDHH